MYLISAYFDENTNKILKHLQQRIADKTGNDFMIRNNVMPHLTISAIEARNVDVLIPAFEKVCREKLQPLDEKGVVNINNTINIVSVGQLFPRVHGRCAGRAARRIGGARASRSAVHRR